MLRKQKTFETLGTSWIFAETVTYNHNYLGKQIHYSNTISTYSLNIQITIIIMCVVYTIT